MKAFSKTDIGRIRAVNEDRVLLQTDMRGLTLAIVADGMGGHRAGDIASQLAIEMIREQLEHIHNAMSMEECEEMIRRAIRIANKTVYEYAVSQEYLQGMGTTVVVAVASDERLVVGHIGDSRAYLAAGGKLEQLTEDHSLVTELLRIGQITPAEAAHHPRRNVVTRALGTEPQVQADVRHLTWKPGEQLLLCSDGLSGLVEDDELLGILQSENSLDAKAELLVEQALKAGGDDNISLVLLECEAGSAVEEGNG